MKYLSGNGIAGVTIHGHLPGLHMAGNEVLDNNIGRRNTVGDMIGLAPPAHSNPDLRTTASWWAARPTSPW
jgi:hypothetical protein